MQDLNREHKIICYTLGVICRMSVTGMCTLPNGLTAKGREACEQVLRSGFRPTEDEILMALTAAANKKVLKFRNDVDKDIIKTMVVEWRPARPH